MTTLYIDVFFLINFTVDILALFFSAKFLHIRTSVARLIVCGAFGAIFSIIDIFLPSKVYLRVSFAFVFLIIAGSFITQRASFIRRVKYIALFIVCELLIGGMVYYGYSVLDKYFAGVLSSTETGGENRKALIFSLLILLVIGAFKLLIMLFTGEKNIKSTEIKIEVEGCVAVAEALVDSGNLVCDPMNMYPVLFVKPKLARTFLPENIIELTDLDSLKGGYRKRIRLIPITKNGSTHVLTGVRVDRVSVKCGKKEEDISVTVAIDKEEGSFGGYEALVPSSAIEDVI